MFFKHKGIGKGDSEASWRPSSERSKECEILFSEHDGLILLTKLENGGCQQRAYGIGRRHNAHL